MRKLFLFLTFFWIPSPQGTAIAQWGRTNPYVYLTTSSDRVGIGTNTPANKLVVWGSGTSLDMARIRIASSDNQAGISFRSDDIGDVILYSPDGSDDLRFQTGGGDKLTLNAGGNLGINTTSPGAHLAVNGNRVALGKSGTLGSYSATEFALEAEAQDNLFLTFTGGISGSNNQSLQIVVGASYDYIGFTSRQAGTAAYLPITFSNGGSERLRITPTGEIGIGTSNPSTSYKLSVVGKIRATDIKVETGWSDFVFDDDYRLQPLSEVESFIRDNGHLPDIPSGEEVESEGIYVGEMQARLLQKIEELTLYVIDIQKQNEKLSSRIRELEKSLTSEPR